MKKNLFLLSGILVLSFSFLICNLVPFFLLYILQQVLLNTNSFIFFASTRIERKLHDVAGEFETRSVC